MTRCFQQQPDHTPRSCMLSPGCADLAAMAVATGSSERLHLDAFDGIPEAAPAATAQDRPSLRRRERSSLLKNRMREIVRRENGESNPCRRQGKPGEVLPGQPS